MVKKGTSAMLIIDMQNDFVSANGALSVNGAEVDAQRVADFININGKNIQHISLTLDYHHPIHIAHPAYWRDKDGNNPPTYTNIKAQDVRDGVWYANYNPLGAIKYLEDLEKSGKTHTIWNPHCIMGSEGSALYPTVADAVYAWEIDHAQPFALWHKGSNWYTEHYSIFKAEVVLPKCPETALNQNLLQVLNNYDQVFLVGEAADFCVANSLKDIVTETPDLAKKVVVLEDCMSWIIAGNADATAIYDMAKNAGVRFAKSTDADLF